MFLDERILTVNVCLHIVWIVSREAFLQFPVLDSNSRVGSHVVPKCDVPNCVWRSSLKRMQLVRSSSRRIIQTKVSTTRNSELSFGLVTQSLE